jgi:glutamyl-tRNA synthetase
VEAAASLDALAAGFDFGHFGRAPAHFDLHEVELLNARLIHQLEFESVRKRLPTDASEADWLLIRPNLARLADFASWQKVIDGDIEPPELGHDDRALVREASQIAQSLEWSGEPWRELTQALKASTGRAGKALFLPLRLALSGRESGPEMAPLVARLGKDRTVARLAAAARR